jgi:hypothetical protein
MTNRIESTSFTATLTAIVLGLFGAVLAGFGAAGIYLTATVDLGAFGAFASFVVLATPYAYAAAAALILAGLLVMLTATRINRLRWYGGGLFLSLGFAAAGGVSLLLASRIPDASLGPIVQGVGVLLLLPTPLLLLATPDFRRR